ncbi:hypothetical protein NCHU2750_07600 [Neorhizobium sp. NCHU2750]|nr:hypothetical protein NCHU2750_07600 [Neorhizobium sp. NCHU2750]
MMMFSQIQTPPNPPHKGEGLTQPICWRPIEAGDHREFSPPLWGRWPAGQRGCWPGLTVGFFDQFYEETKEGQFI